MSTPLIPTVGDTSNYNPVAVKVITRAFRIMGVINDQETPTAEMTREGLDALNSLLKELQAANYHVWTEEEAILFLQQYQIKYALGPAPDGTPSPDHCADADSWELTTLELSAIAGATTVVVADPTDIAKGDYFGVVTNAGNAFWTTVKIDPAGSTITLTDALTGDANAGNFVFAYTTNIVRPLRIPFCRRLQYATSDNAQGNIITPLAPMMSRQAYFNLPQPKTSGLITQAYYNPARDQGQIYVWNSPSSAVFGLRFTWYRPLIVFTETVNVPDLPDEWGSALNWNLGRELLTDYSVPAERAQLIRTTAGEKLELVTAWDREPESVYFGRASGQTRGGA